MSAASVPPAGAFALVNARVPVAVCDGLALRDADPASGLATTDLYIRDGRFAAAPERQEHVSIDAAGTLVLPGFVDMHVHLDKAYTVHRTGLPEGGLLDAVCLSVADAPNRTEDDLRARMRRSLERAYANGTVALRTHLDTPDLPQESPAWRVFVALREEFRDRLELQAVALMALERVDAPGFSERCAQIARLGGVLGMFVPPAMADAERLGRLFDQAGKHGLDVDFHVDETLDVRADGLATIAEAVLASGFSRRVVVGHCCSLSAQPHDVAAATLDRVALAGLHVVALPATNLFLQDRDAGRTPRRRGLTLVKEMRARGIAVSFASDNVCDPFYPYGDFDMFEIMRETVRLAHLEAEIGAWADAFARRPAETLGLAPHGRLAPGQPADFVQFAARDWIDLFCRSRLARCVVRNGRPIDGTLPQRPDTMTAQETI
ncbi:cytosine deaminase [Nitratireductor alexandrii]|uniref:cytosine deaminase n=1 Tax=Nitratireductor alexandrii TaxID=2448161 RepID=UPI000FD709AE|nr:cytosine deaminase [Nitratireductor alexandrii]